MIVGLVSTYQEGQLGVSAVRSLLAACDAVRVFEGPIGEEEVAKKRARAQTERDVSIFQAFRRDPRVTVRYGAWPSDAEKRTGLVATVRASGSPRNDKVWGVVLDGDELLLWGEYLPDYIAFLAASGQHGGHLHLVELDGSVSMTGCRILPLWLVERYVSSVNVIEFVGGITRAFPNQPLLVGQSGPLQGEPHILHRTALRDPARQSERQHVAEARSWEKIEAEGGLAGITKAVEPQSDGVRIWLPE